MRLSGDRGLRNVAIGCAGLLAASAAVGIWAKLTPVYTVPFAQASEAFQAWCGPDGNPDDAAGDRYLAMFGIHYALADICVALLLAALTIGALAFVLRRTRRDGEPWLRTPRYPGNYIAIGLGIVAWTFAALAESFNTDLQRHYFPWCADSMGIPIGALRCRQRWSRRSLRFSARGCCCSSASFPSR